MKKNDYEGSDQFRPLSPWAYFGYSLLFMIPIVGLISLIVFAFSRKNINRRNFARGYWCAFLVVIIVSIAFSAIQNHLIVTSTGIEWNEKNWSSISDALHVNPVTPDFKAAMDSYEVLVDEYIEFTEIYTQYGNSLPVFAEYMIYKNQYNHAVEKMEAIDADALPAADSAYYLEVMTRVNKKLTASLS